MERVLGIGGIFFKSRDPRKLGTWYRKNLGLDVTSYGIAIFHERRARGGASADTVWAPFPKNTRYFAPSRAPFMINYRVTNLDRMLAQLRKRGVHVFEETQKSEQGYFGWALDPEGNKIELWQPPRGTK